MNLMGVMASFSSRQGFKDTVGEFGKPNPHPSSHLSLTFPYKGREFAIRVCYRQA